MRTLARMLLSVQELEPSVESLGDCITTSKFDIVIKATKKLYDYNPGTRHSNSKFSKPGLILNIGYDLHKAAILLRGQAIR